MLSALVHFLMSMFALRLTAIAVPGVEVKDWTAAFLGAVVMAVTGIALGMLLPYLPAGAWRVYGAIAVIASTLGLGAAALVVPGVRVSGFLALILGGLLMAVVMFAALVLSASTLPVF